MCVRERGRDLYVYIFVFVREMCENWEERMCIERTKIVSEKIIVLLKCERVRERERDTENVS